MIGLIFTSLNLIFYGIFGFLILDAANEEEERIEYSDCEEMITYSRITVYSALIASFSALFLELVDIFADAGLNVASVAI